MIEQSTRHFYQKFLVNPIAVRLTDQVSPNTTTFLSGIMGVLVCPALYYGYVVFAVILLLLSGYCDTLDGTLARMNESSTSWGSVLDIMTDRLVELTVVLALWSIDPNHRGLWCLIMLSSMLLCITSFLVVGIFTENQTHKSFHYSQGIMERAEAFIFFIAMMLWPAAFVYLAALFSFLVTITAVIRLHQFYKQTKGLDSCEYPNKPSEKYPGI